MIKTFRKITEIGIMYNDKETEIQEYDYWLPIQVGEIVFIYGKAYDVLSKLFALELRELCPPGEDGKSGTYENIGVLSFNVKETSV